MIWPGVQKHALKAVMSDESGLQGMQLLAACDAFDGSDLGAIVTHRQSEARVDAPAVDENGAGATLAAVASLFGSGQMQLLPQEIEQRHARVGERNVSPRAVDDKADGVAHVRLQSVCGRASFSPAACGSNHCGEHICGGILRLARLYTEDASACKWNTKK
jgi:hypothetical protein